MSIKYMPSSLEIFRACHGGLLGLFTSVDIIGTEGYSVLFQWYRCTRVYMSRSKLPFIHFDINFRLVTYYSDTVMTSPDGKMTDVSHLRSFSGQACVLRVVHSVFGKLLVFFLTQRHGTPCPGNSAPLRSVYVEYGSKFEHSEVEDFPSSVPKWPLRA